MQTELISDIDKNIPPRRKRKKKKIMGALLGFFIILLLLFIPFLPIGHFEQADTDRLEDVSTSLTIATNDHQDGNGALAAELPSEDNFPIEGAHQEGVMPPSDEKIVAPSVDDSMDAGADDPEQAIPMVGYNDQEMVVYLTIDDGPSAYSQKLLDILENYGINATFFMLEPNMQKYPDAVTRIVKDGHMPGMHGVTHRKEIVYASKDSVVYEMLQGQKAIEALTGFKSPLIRVPYGSNPHMKPEYKQAVTEAGLIMWDWNVDSLDWKLKKNAYVAHTAKQVEKLKSAKKNPVILIHDRQETVMYLPQLLDYLIEQGYRFETIEANVLPLQFGS